MKCRIRAFGITREILNERELILELPQGATVADLKRELFSRYPPLTRLSSLFVAVNTEYAPEERKLTEDCEIALIPPVSGG